MKLSIIIPVYNAALTIDRLLSSVLHQKHQQIELEMVIVNDGSTDESKTILDHYSESHQCINVYHTENQGVYKARNLALTKITGDYVWMLDADDYISENAFEVLHNIYEQEDFDVVNFGYNLEEVKGDFKIKFTQKNENNTVDGINFLAQNDGRLYLWNNVYNVKFLKKSNLKFLGKSVSLEDSLFNLNVFVKAKKVLLSDKVMYTYAFQETSISRKTNFEHLVKRAESSYNVHIHTKKLRDSFKHSSFTFEILNERLSHSILGFFYSLLIENYPVSYVKHMRVLYGRNKLLPVNKKDISLKLKLFQFVINHKVLHLCALRLYRFKNSLY